VRLFRRRRRLSLGAIVWVVIGVIVAVNHHFFEHLDTVSRLLSAVMAVMLWPLVLLGIHFGI
jgi:ABC-type anion transport system duplicated permease subunit